MNRQIVIPRDKLEPFLGNLEFYNSTASTPPWDEVTFTRHHNLNKAMCVKIFSTIPAGCNQTDKSNRKAIIVRGLGPDGTILYEAKILRVNSVKSTLERILGTAREAYGACNEYYKKILKPQVPPSPKMVSDYRRGQINGLFQAIYLLQGKADENVHYCSNAIRCYPLSAPHLIRRLLNDQILCLQELSENLTPDVQ